MYFRMNVDAPGSSHGSQKMFWILPIFIVVLLLLGVVLYAVKHKK